MADETALLVDARKRHGTYQAGVQRIADLVKAGKQAEATFAADEEMIPMMAPFLATLGKMDEAQAARAHAAEQANQGLIASTRVVSAVVGLAAALFAILAGFLVVRSITRPVARALEIARSVADGNLGQRVDVIGRDEIAHLLLAMNRMSEHLSERVSRVRTAADMIATASREIAAGNSDLSARTEQQASSLEQTAAAMEELNGTVQAGAASARSASALASEARSVAEQGSEVVSRVVTMMEEISASSRKIGEIIGIIDGIAFQTNILALNAAVEAARAGEQGRGFAVVAGEVRNLAQRSAQAANEIKLLIGESVDGVEAGAKLVQDAGHTMAELTSRVHKVNELIAEISAAVGEQCSGIAQINGAVTHLDQTTQQNAALVEQSAAATESLRQQAEDLRDAVGVFQL
jgi:methyl-accepting chemotaxis protein